MSSPIHHHQFLLLGAGELGTAFLPHLSSLPNTHITIAIRTPSKYAHLSGPNTSLLSLDISGPSEDLAKTFANYSTVIICTGFGQPAGTITKLAKEILQAGLLRKEAGLGKLWFFPWQWGVDYDVTGDCGGLMPLFGEQLQVRKLLRSQAAQSHVTWTIVSTGIFMSFLFEPFWGVVGEEKAGAGFVVRALKSWEHKVTVTSVSDIGKTLARVVAGDVESEDRILYIAGDTVSYAELAGIVGRVTGKNVRREEWTTQHLEEELAKDPENLIKKYRVVFAGEGVWWDKEITVNYKLGMPLTGVEMYAKQHLAA
ncbi:NAD(P)-binding protein [Lindgomyces ingoldianus]|uniref:NAD(P)-binding protein n=1 Tax=Lindgomyces ingoldianus TaxID=673940 RepID=A0ACB6QNK0_9PLEO|nr:NAD(P)-binding protein [Lindgomyces ingoldianus]KAF2468452.1 NAD(P)-binding protein [Lindgomyces ingoldianus]